MTERLSDERLHHILREYTDDCGWEVNAGEVGDMTEELFALRAENAHLRQRCAWLQERRAVLRKLVASRWSKRREVRRLRAKLAEWPWPLDAGLSWSGFGISGDEKSIAEVKRLISVDARSEDLQKIVLEQRAKLSAGPVMPVADLYALCEATKEQTYDSGNEFNRGRYFEAKHIAKAVMAAGY